MTGRKRKEAKVIKRIESASVEPLSIEHMVLTDKNGYKICEINSSPSFEWFEKEFKIPMSEIILKMVLKKLV